MRLLPWLALAISLMMVSSVEGRLFWQTYGSTVLTADGCGCTWNANQDYFVPRHSSTGQYGLYSSCKSSRSTSPACKTCHPLYPGYCGIYGSCHYNRRDRVYAAKCGCSPLSGCVTGNGGTRDRVTRAGVTGSCAAGNYPSGVCHESVSQQYGYVAGCASELVGVLHNVEPAHFDSLGSIPIEGNGLLTSRDFSQLGDPKGELEFPQGGLPSLHQLQQQIQQLQQVR